MFAKISEGKKQTLYTVVKNKNVCTNKYKYSKKVYKISIDTINNKKFKKVTMQKM